MQTQGLAIRKLHRRGCILALLLVALTALAAAGCQSPDIVAQPRYTPGDAALPQGSGQAIALVVKDSRKNRGKAHENLGELIAPMDTRHADGGVYLQQSPQQTLQAVLEAAFTTSGFKITPDAPVVVGAELRTLELDAKQFTHSRLDPDTGYPWDPLRLLLPSPVRPTSSKIAMTLSVSKEDRALSYDFIEASSDEKSSSRSVVDEVLSRCLTRVATEGVNKAAEKITLAMSLPVSDRELAARETAIAQKQVAVTNLQRELEQRLADLSEQRQSFVSLQAGVAEAEKTLNLQRQTLAAEKSDYERSWAKLKAEREQFDSNRNDLGADRELREADLKLKESTLQARAQELETRASTFEKQSADLKNREANLLVRLRDLAASEEQQKRSAASLVEQSELSAKQNADLATWENRLKQWERELEQIAAAPASSPQAVPAASLVPPGTLVARDPPKILIGDPPQGTNVDTTLKQVSVRGIVLDSREIVSVDGFRWEGDKKLKLEKSADSSAQAPASGAPRMWEEFSFLAELRQGRNRIAIEAANSEGLRESQEISILQKEADGQTFLLAIGVDKYEQANVPPLRHAVADAQALAACLADQRGIPSENIVMRLNQRATRQELSQQIFTDLASRAGKNDTIVICFSGHGLAGAGGGPNDGQESFLLPFDARPADLPGTALSVAMIARALEGLQSERTIFLADTCYSGNAGGRTFSLSEGNSRRVPLDLGERLDGKGRVIITASKASEVAQEDADLGHGVFSYYLIRGIEGEADSNRDRLVTLTELYDYVRTNVSRRTNGAQNPQIKRDSAIGEMVISRLKR